MHLTTAYREKCGLAQKRVLVVSSFQGGGVIFPRVTLTFLTLKNPFLTADNG